MARLMERYKKEIVSRLMEQFGLGNLLAVPKIEKIVVSMGVGKAVAERKALEHACRELSTIAGQKPLVTKAKKSIAGFKLRKGMPIGCKVTLRGRRMYEFLDRLINIAIPRFRDFRGLSRGSFDDGGNFNMGITDQAVFPEVDLDKIEFQQGMNVTIVIQNSDREKSLALLGEFGMPFRRDVKEEKQ